MLLEKMNKGVGKIVITFLAVLLIISFAVWGLGDFAGGSSNRGIAQVGGTEITQREFRSQFRREMDRMRSRLGNIDAQQARTLGLADSTLNGLISRRLLSLQASELGLLVSNEQVVSQIQSEPAFRNAAGQFDRSVFQVTLANNGLSEDAYVASLRQDTQQDYIGEVISAGTSVPPLLTQSVLRYRNERRSADVIKINRSTLRSAPTPSDTELKSYLDQNTDQFQSPEYRVLSFLHLDPAEVAKELSPSDEKIKQEYDNRLSSLSIPEVRRIEQIFLKDKETMAKAHATLSEGRSFQDVAKRFSGKSGDDIKLGLLKQGDLLPDLGTAAFALKKDEFTKPLKSSLGWHILRVSEIQLGREPKLEEVRKEISNDLALELALDDLVTRANRVEDTLAGGATIEDAAREAGMKVQQNPPIDTTKKTQTGLVLEGLPTDRRFIETAFSLKSGASSNLIESENGGYFMLRVDRVVEAAKLPLSQVRKKVEQEWKSANLSEVAKNTADQIRDKAIGGVPLSEIAKRKGLIVEKSKPVSRFDAEVNAVIPQQLLAELFKAKTGDIVMSRTPQGFAIAKLTAIENEPQSADDKNFRQLQETLSTAIANDILQEYTRALRNEYAVSINQQSLNAFFTGQGFGDGYLGK
jgi:peptidyl-prolyl cis-trans isomerase D